MPMQVEGTAGEVLQVTSGRANEGCADAAAGSSRGCAARAGGTGQPPGRGTHGYPLEKGTSKDSVLAVMVTTLLCCGSDVEEQEGF